MENESMDNIRDEFLSEEDLDLRNLSEDELIAHWNLWLREAQATNDLDWHTYSHGVFTMSPAITSSALPRKKSLRANVDMVSFVEGPSEDCQTNK
jgi:hypothetical protein